MLRVARNEHEVTGFDSPGLVANPESALAFKDEYEFVVIRLDVDDVCRFFENIDVARNVLTVTQEGPLDRVGGGCLVRSETMNRIRHPKEVLRVHAASLRRL